MALLSDGRISTLDQLQMVDSAVGDVARVERVDIDNKLVMAADEVRLKVQKFLIDQGLAFRVALPYVVFDPLTTVPATVVDLSRIVVTPVMQRWHAMETLAMVYSDAYFSQLNDRYQQKWTFFQDRAVEESKLLFDTGIGAVTSGVTQAAAPTVTESGTTFLTITYYVSIAWRNAQGVQGMPSDPVVFTTSQTIIVAASETVPTGWTFDVYVGMGPLAMTKQNGASIDAAGSWQMPVAALIAGDAPPAGQAPEYYLRRDRTWQRG